MFMFPEALLPVVVYLVTAGVKSVFGRISGWGSMLMAAGVASVLVFGEAVIGGLGGNAGEIATALVELLLLVAATYGLHDVVKTEIGRRA